MSVILNVSIVVLLIVLCIWTWNSLGDSEKKKKIIYIVIGTLAMYIITKIIFAISSSSIIYQNEEIKKQITNMLVYIFTPVNGFIILPQIAKWMYKLKNKEIDKSKFKQKLIILFVIFVVIVAIEIPYLRDTQMGIINMAFGG